MPSDMRPTSKLHLLEDGPGDADSLLILAHGAGQRMDSPFMTAIATRVSNAPQATRVVRFEFPYMAQQRATGRRRPPDRTDTLLARWRQVVETVRTSFQDSGALFIGGKSMGGRIASMVVDELGCAGCVCLGYPFHPPGRPERTRTEHLSALTTPTLICQGERDPFGRPDEIASYRLSDTISLFWLPDGDHSFKPRKRSGRSEDQNWDAAGSAICEFIARHRK